MASYGSDYTARNQQSGDVVADGGATLLSPFSEGETAIMAGPALLREIQAGVANGDMSVTPVDPTANISAENNLPYWTYTDVNSSGAITAAIVADAGAASGNVLRFTIASGTLTGKSATLSRYVPVASSASRSFSFYAEATFDGGTNSTQATAKVTCQFYKADQATTTGTAFESAVYGFNSLQGATGVTAPDLYAVAPDLTNTTAPADAAYLKITITIATVATQSADRVVDLTEVRLAHGLPELILTDKGDPATYQPAYIFNESGDLSLVASTGENLVVGMNGYWLGSVSNTMESGGDLNLIATGDIIGTAANVDITATTLMNLNADTISVTGTTDINLDAPDTRILGNNSNLVSRITATAAQSLTNNTLTKITFNTASATPAIGSYDPQGWFDNAADSIIIGQDGFYNITANLGFASNATSRRLVLIYVNGTDRAGVQVGASPAGTTLLSISTNLWLVVGDEVQLYGLQQSGGALNTVGSSGVTPVLAVGRIGA